MLLNLLRPDTIIDKNTFYEMAEPNEHINLAARIIRSQKDNWREEAQESLNKACQTKWGKRVFQDNPSVQSIFEVLKKEDITVEQKVQLISDVENMHTFSNIISRTRRRDIGEFTVRKPKTVTVEFTPEQRILHDEIISIIDGMLAQIHCTDNTKFMMTTIRRQTASCLFGLVPMLNNILYRHIYEMIDDEEFDTKELNKETSVEEIHSRIKTILELVENLDEYDPKVDALMEIVSQKQKEPKKKIMVFSSFKHTLNYLDQKLKSHGYRVGMIHGEIKDDDRRELRNRFDPSKTPDDSSEAIDVMLFSEVGCEGLDYQFCDCIINYDLPWNPMRVEQRIGRIDRNGQTSESVAIYNLITPGTVDADIYDRCLMRIGVFNRSIGDCEEILGNTTSEIRKLVENFELTDQERREKMQQLADNKIRYIKEQEILEEKQGELFGLRIPSVAFNNEIKDATNYWLSTNHIQNMVECYLKKTLKEDKEYFLGDKPLKTLRLSQSARRILREDFLALKFPKNEINRDWSRWLDVGEQHLAVTFDNNCWKENPNAVFLSITHPLVKQAAAFLQSKGQIVTALSVTTNEFAPGEYPFAVFQWKLSGEREDLQIKSISAEPTLNKILFDLLKKSSSIEIKISNNVKMWEDVEAAHHEMWKTFLEEHKSKTEAIIRYKEASLKSSHAARMSQLKSTLEKSTDPKYRIMQEGKIRIAEYDYISHLTDLHEAREKADILFELLAYGMLVIRPNTNE